MNGMVNQQRNDEGLRELALFAGAGGGILGGHLLGWRTVCAVEYNAYARSVLLARQNDRTLSPFPIWDDVRTFDGKPWRGIVDVISGGFPCQDISAAGKGAGLEGERSGLWREFARIIGEVRPQFVFVENSPMLTSRGLGTVLGDLAEMGFDAEWGVVSAADTGAPHLRERIWIVAYANSSERRALDDAGNGAERRLHGWRPEASDRAGECSQVLANTKGEGCATGGTGGREKTDGKIFNMRPIDGSCNAIMADASSQHVEGLQSSVIDAQERGRQIERPAGSCGYGFGRWPVEPDVGRVVNGLAQRVDRLKAIGNGQVPLCAATAWRLLANI